MKRIRLPALIDCDMPRRSLCLLLASLCVPGHSMANSDRPGCDASSRPWLPALRHSTAPLMPVTSDERIDASLTEWTERTLTLIAKYRRNPLRAARCLCYMHAVLHDALWLSRAHPAAVRSSVAQQAAARMLAYLFPQEDQHAAAPMTTPAGVADVTTALAEQVFAAAVERAWQDGSDREWLPQMLPPAQQGAWRPSPPLRVTTPLEALAGEWQLWTISEQEVPQAPPPVRGVQAAAELEEVWQVRQQLTDRQKAIADYWNLDQGTITPAGLWNRIALPLLTAQFADPAATIAALALLNAVMMDALIVCWRTKYRWWTERPVTALRAGRDPHFLPWLLTPPFPSYVSGHATVSGAAARVLGRFLPEHHAKLEAMAEEAAWSRLLGGIHPRNDNEAGLALGRAVADAALAGRASAAGGCQ